MTKKTIESIDYSSAETYPRKGGACNYEVKDVTYEDIQKENQQLRESVQNLEQKLKYTETESEQRYNDLLAAVSKLAKRVHSESLQEPNSTNKKVTDGSVKQMSQDLADLDLRFQLHENSTTDGHLIWKINDFENRTNDAIIGKVRALHSAPCFTGKYGYKFCLRLYLHGDGMGRGTHLSLFLVIMKSEYDDILQWPFQQKIKFKLINQNDRSKDHVEQMFPSKDSSSFQKPKKDMNIASGCPLFIPLDRLQPEGFLKNGNLFVEVKIE